MKITAFLLCGLVATASTATLLTAATTKAGNAQASPSNVAHDEHIVRRGETLWSIAQSHGTSVGEIMDYNHLPNETVRAGMNLKIPRAVKQDTRNARKHVHIVEEGQTFWSIAEDYGVSSEGLAKANPNVNPNRVHADMELVIPPEEPGNTSPEDLPAKKETTAPSKTLGGTHTVSEGETFYSIGRRHGVSSDALIAANPSVKPERLRQGMIISIPNKPTANTPVKTKTTAPVKSSGSAVLHTVRERESVSSIAKKYGVSEDALSRQNKLNVRDTLHPGDILTIPGTGSPVRQTSSPTARERTTMVSRPATSPSANKTLGPSNTSPAPKPNVKKGAAVESYIVSSGETEYTIAEAFSISKQQLYDYNQLDNSTKLRSGDEIMIPARK